MRYDLIQLYADFVKLADLKAVEESFVISGVEGCTEVRGNEESGFAKI